MNNYSNAILLEQENVNLLKKHKKNKNHPFISCVSGYLVNKGIQLSDVKKFHWCGDNSGITNIAGEQHNKNPSDILMEFEDGTFYGISLKKTKKADRITLKNPGLGSIGTYLGFNYNNIHDAFLDRVINTFALSTNQSERKTQIRSSTTLRKIVEKQGDALLHLIINSELYGIGSLYQKKPHNENVAHILEDWFSISANDIPYVGIIKKDDEYTVEDYRGDKRIKMLRNCNQINWICNKKSIVINVDGLDIMRMRIKFESQKLASSIKFSGELIKLKGK